MGMITHPPDAPSDPDPLLSLIRQRANRRLIVLALSDERDMWEARELATGRRALREGLADGWRDGFAAGYQQAEIDMAADWARLTEPVAHPGRAAQRRIQAALAGERRDAVEHERRFVARAWNTHRRDRTLVQRSATRLYPPPNNPHSGRSAS